MKFSKSSAIATLLAAGLFSGCDRSEPAVAKASASSPGDSSPASSLPPGDPGASRDAFAAAGKDGSPHFAKVIGRLDVGGKMIQFQDHEGRRDLLIAILDAIVSTIPEARTRQMIDTAKLVDASGLAHAAASGRSLIKDGDAWLLRGYEYLPEGRSGLSNLFGREPFAFKSPALLPAATDLVIETRLDATVLPDLIGRICAATGNSAAAAGLLDKPLPNGETAGSIMAKTDLHVIIGVDVSSWPEKPVLPKPVDYFVRIEGCTNLLPLLLPQLEQGFGKPAAFGARQGWEIPLPSIGLPTKGVLLFDEAGTLVLASRNEYLKIVDTAAMKLADWKEYQAASDHFPASGNFLLYASPQVPAVVGWAIRQAAEESGQEGSEFIVKATEYLQPRSYSCCVAYEKDGIAFTAELPFAAEVSMGDTLPVLSATSVLFVGARAWKSGSDRAACILNVRNVQQAVRGHQNMNDLKPGAPVPWSSIFGADKYIPERPSCAAGGTYTYAKTIPTVGKLACTCSNPDHAPEKHDDW